MAEILTTNGAVHYIEQVFLTAKQQVILISPFLQISEHFWQRMQEADKRGVSITLVYRETNWKDEELDRLRALRKISIYNYSQLHAKCFGNERFIVMGSMNLYEFSQRNREMGILLNATSDRILYDDAMREMKSIIGISQKEEINPRRIGLRNQGQTKNIGYNKAPQQVGFCVRCEVKMSYDPSMPLCFDCYDIWAHYGNPGYPENFCHKCGEPADVCKAFPLCYSCNGGPVM